MSMQLLGRLLLCAALAAQVACGGGGDGAVSPGPSQAQQALTLPIAPVAQQTPVWCWAASSEMVFRYYQLPALNASSYQCGIIAVVFGNACAFDCGACVLPIGTLSNLKTVVEGYGWAVRSFGINSRVLSSQMVFSALSFEATRNEIAAGRPIFVGFSPSGGIAIPNVSQHVAVLVGYDATNGRADVILNDPFPYALAGMPDPYFGAGATMVQPGQYRLPHSALVQRLAWANTLYAVQ
jgi:hypothetical protein